MNVQELLARYQQLQASLQGLIQQKQALDTGIFQLKDIIDWLNETEDERITVNLGLVSLTVPKDVAKKKFEDQIEKLEIRSKSLENQIKVLQQQLETLGKQIQEAIQKQQENK
jgi:prefoldin beta subunit